MRYSYKSFWPRIRLAYAVSILTFALLSTGGGHMPDCLQSEVSSFTFYRVAWADELSEDDIQWFRDEMKISPKFQEYKEGVWGMSWAHFITMVFLIIFFIATLVAMYIRNKQTKKILKALLKEE